MTTLIELPAVKARKAVEALELAYAYYTPQSSSGDALKTGKTEKTGAEYYEYVPAA
ncbi:hypothetical protein I5535_15195 [Rhodobacteraceae bacterium F11138]|nr:hypothetical protein [Rhodobacteraceae bacterium F11138]